jgi:hypothetical protein
MDPTSISDVASKWRWELRVPSLACLLTACLTASGLAAEPIKLHPDNPHYFLFRGQPAVLITSGEHYGALLNRDFDYVRYLDVLKSHGFNLTRTFSGAYREVPGSFGITGNTLAPAPDRFVCPWARSSTPGASDGGNKFDLGKWDAAYFDRLKDFVREAGKRGIVVEVVLFCTMYDEKVWQASPLNAANNVNGIGQVGRYEVYDGRNKPLVDTQTAMTRKIVSELAEYDNVYFEVCNEPYERGGLTSEWNDAIIGAIVEAEKSLPAKHLIAQGIAVRAAEVKNPSPHVSVFNFHAATPEAVRLNYALNKALADDETGGSDQSDRRYRTEAWEFLLAGGSVFDHLDFSFTTDREDGSAVPLPDGTPGGGGPELRRQLQVLKGFLESFEFLKLKPNSEVLKEQKIAAGANEKPAVYVLADVGTAYAAYVRGGTQADLVFELPPGAFAAQWISTRTGKVEKEESFAHGGGKRTLSSPGYSEDIALRIQKARPSP